MRWVSRRWLCLPSPGVPWYAVVNDRRGAVHLIFEIAAVVEVVIVKG